MKTIKWLLLFITFIPHQLVAQRDNSPVEDDGVELTISTDVVSQYIWRGQEMGSVSIQPTFGMAYKGLSLTAQGNVGVSDTSDPKELDLMLSYAMGGLNVGITDYWVNAPEERYFLYDAHRTNHVFEANIGYDFGVASLQWYTNFAGADGVNNDGDRAYSSYIEACAPFRLAGAEWTAAAGVVPFATDYYATRGFAVTHLSLMAQKELRITDTFSLPLFAQVVATPCSQKAHLVVGLTLTIE